MVDRHVDEATLNEYLDGALPPPRRSAVEQHLDGCPACRAHLFEMQTLFTALDGLPEVPLGRDLSASVVEKLASSSRPTESAADASVARALILVQIAVACGLLVLSWPLVVPRLDAATLGATHASLLVWRAELWRSLAGPWQSALGVGAAWTDAGRQLLTDDALLLPAALHLPPLWWGILVMAAAIAWVAGNYWGLARRRNGGLARNGERR